MKVLITGINGMLGHAVAFRLIDQAELFGVDQNDPSAIISGNIPCYRADVSDAASMKQIIQQIHPDYVVHCAAYTNVDKCEIEKELSWRVNVKSLEHLSYFSRIFHFHLIHFSTDYIFDGRNGPYQTDDRPNPINYYGKGKLASENVVISQAEAFTIIRTNVLFDYYPDIKLNFISWLVKKLSTGESVNVVTDQWNNPCFARDLAEIVYRIMERGIQGIYHSGSEEYLSRYDLALMVARIGDFDPTLIRPVLTKDLNQLAPRPLKGGLRIEKTRKDLHFSPIPLEKAIRQILKEMHQQGEM